MAEARRLVDKPDKLTVSDVHCGEQRRIYDERRRALVPRTATRCTSSALPSSRSTRRGRLLREPEKDEVLHRELLDTAAAPGQVHEHRHD